MIEIWIALVILLGHWFDDFVWQPHWMGTRKSKEWWVLAQHAGRIAAGSFMTLAIVTLFTDTLTPTDAVIFGLINGVTHFGVDAVTSRMTSKLYAKQDFHSFFVVIGFDQFLHLGISLTALAWLAQ